MANLNNLAGGGLELANLAATLERLDGGQLKELRQTLLPTRLRVVNTEDSKLLQIPQEIRDAIYDEILESEKNAGVWFTKKPTLSPGQEIFLHPLFRVCHQLREEFAMKFWKKISISQMTSMWIIKHRIARLDLTHRKFITRMEYNAGSKYETLVRGVMQIENKECATWIAKRLEDQLELKPGIVWITFPNRFDKEMACWFNHARVNSLGEVEDRNLTRE